MTSYEIGLLAHIAAVFLLVGATAIEWTCLRLVRQANRTEDLRNSVGVARGLEIAFPVASIAILASGIYMLEKAWGWDDDWVIVSLAAFIGQSAIGAGVTTPRLKAITKAAHAESPGPMSAALTARVSDPILWGAEAVLITLLLAIGYMMVVKPGIEEAIGSIVVAVVAALAWVLITQRMAAGRAGAVGPTSHVPTA